MCSENLEKICNCRSIVYSRDVWLHPFIIISQSINDLCIMSSINGNEPTNALPSASTATGIHNGSASSLSSLLMPFAITTSTYIHVYSGFYGNNSHNYTSSSTAYDEDDWSTTSRESMTSLPSAWMQAIIWLNVVGNPIVIVVGLTGNGLCLLVVLGSHLRRQSTTIYLAFLSMVDSVFLLTLVSLSIPWPWLWWSNISSTLANLMYIHDLMLLVGSQLASVDWNTAYQQARLVPGNHIPGLHQQFCVGLDSCVFHSRAVGRSVSPAAASSLVQPSTDVPRSRHLLSGRLHPLQLLLLDYCCEIWQRWWRQQRRRRRRVRLGSRKYQVRMNNLLT